MEFKARVNIPEFQALERRLKNAGKQAKNVMKSSMRRNAKPIIKEWRDECPVLTGATQRSLGVIARKEGIMIGVRPNYVDVGGKDRQEMNPIQHEKFVLKHRSAQYKRNTGKKPIIYSARVNARSKAFKGWFGKVWNSNKNKLPHKIFAELKTQLTKKGF